ncbi:tRNA lysidine(34) synthetase TilS [Leptospira borgpetersenii serovar Hardjo-bovis]|uniref:tRNA(Ile)-lysidine synthase n=3 Tax=Leptospira borgpetersenii serovar Hardjo-bovis TaxID=338217 RepID=TILS_LEPBJ|nr:RecName: Full=tRNA(Ile)-lysidine synthase; AltName: Full=tRNA(Ile)-2-lysyl-cytidine synthase; AltName: Full=tRNA(Ile)-lysidine synthetase [Leptospira borgpetersenii serovar Hardjo-bovis str. JB197]Q04XC4.1 RecName: Full=tRNA(Ile)-lysidine synthase; AltName: Full=tRNA(Ile)-2-lysyl-cytidine synthase; AltName: Full=tRNA(Ile)-lysidine synthetase [Leptospira borgpetersenii serovar Hardjo-bovis str. L550]AMX59742.1 tRNA(Ile)-lysidine synthase [Leptospira borgpetersenii serovar Hardjo]AYR09878.1 tRN
MRDKISESTRNIFDTVWKRIFPFHEMILSRPAVLSYSGGKDSSLLLHFYFWLWAEKKIPVPCIYHLDHSIRFNLEQEKKILDYTESTFPFPNLFKKKNIPALSQKLGKTLEETGRAFRYKDLEKISNQYEGYIVTGHHSTDYLETVFLNLIRGGGWNSLRTLGWYEKNRFRPLFAFTEDEIKTISQSESWPIFEDESNQSNEYLRNRIRNYILPLLLQEGADPDRIYKNFHRMEKPTSKILLKEVSSHKTPSFLKIDVWVLNDLSERERKFFIDRYLRSLNLHPTTRNFFQDLMDCLKKMNSFGIENKEAWFWKSSSYDLYVIPKNSLCLKKFKLESKNMILKWNGSQKKISPGFIPGLCSPGAKIRKNGMSIEISEILRQKEIPVPVRKMLPILYREGKVDVICLSLWDPRLGDIVADRSRNFI